jgi:hypothetical protein
MFGKKRAKNQLFDVFGTKHFLKPHKTTDIANIKIAKRCQIMLAKTYTKFGDVFLVMWENLKKVW